MDENQSSIYDLITKLCKNIATKSNKPTNKIVKVLRAKAYEILLSKYMKPLEENTWMVKDIKDPWSHLLVWQFILLNDYNHVEHVEKLKQYIQQLKNCLNHDMDTFNSLLCLLLKLCKPPEKNNGVMNKMFTSNFIFPVQNNSQFSLNFDTNMFNLPGALLCQNSKYNDQSFRLTPVNSKSFRARLSLTQITLPVSRHNINSCTCHISSGNISCKLNRYMDVNCNSVIKFENETNVWENILDTPFTDRRTWECYGDIDPPKELNFLSDLGNKSNVWNNYLLALNVTKTSNVNIKCLTQEQFIKDVKYLLVGMMSHSFDVDEDGNFILISGTNVEGISTGALKSYCKDFLFCGSCYKIVYEFCENLIRNQQHGYIFHEFCESLKRYLSFYRLSVFAMLDYGSCMSLQMDIKQLKEHLNALTSAYDFKHLNDVCGVELLNCLYQKVFDLTDQNTLMMFCSILYPCCQLYFHKFLQQWLFDGTVNDEYNEFFIIPSEKYLATRGRTYWTRGFTVLDNIVPDFLKDVKTDILLCGKSMNLLNLCVPKSSLSSYINERKNSLLTYCLTSKQILGLEQNTRLYYLEALNKCGNFFMTDFMQQFQQEDDPYFLNLVTKKRSITFKRMELERQKVSEETLQNKMKEMAQLKEQYEKALEQKHMKLVQEIQRDIDITETNINLENMRNKLIEDEAKTLISYYNQLYEISETKLLKIEKHIEKLKSVQLNTYENDSNKLPDQKEDESYVPCEVNVSDESVFVSAEEEVESPINDNDNMTINSEQPSEIHSSHSLDILNANSDVNINKTKTLTEPINVNIIMAKENFEIARKNKAKIMSLELGINLTPTVKSEIKETVSDIMLTDAQRNKLKVMSSEFGININKETYSKLNKPLSAAEINKRKNMNSNECFFSDPCDNENFINKNLEGGDTIKNINEQKKEEGYDKKELLTLDVKTNDNQALPMSVDSTPLSEISHKTEGSTPIHNKLFLNIEKGQFEDIQSFSVPDSVTTAATNFTDEGFNFMDYPEQTKQICCIKNQSNIKKPLISNVVSQEDVESLTSSNFHLFLQKSITIPLTAHAKLVNSELLKYFVNDLQFITHLINLKNYFFLQDGEFGRNITEGLFEKLYDSNFPIELINCKTLQMLVRNALDSSCKYQTNSHLLSFKINNLPSFFNLGDPNVLNCLSFTYKVNWPLNIILPVDAIEKYDEVFKFLLMLHRISWVQKKIFQQLKTLAKETGKKEIYLMSSPQYKRLHQCRHVITHFIETLQSYIVGQVFQSNWKIFQNNLAPVTNLDDLYIVHATYIKNILFMCFLNKRSEPIKKIFEKIFTVILKFYDYLRSREWYLEDGHYLHPNFNKLECFFLNFEEFVVYLFKVCHKVIKKGYQPHLLQLLDMLNVNEYYTNKCGQLV